MDRLRISIRDILRFEPITTWCVRRWEGVPNERAVYTQRTRKRKIILSGRQSEVSWRRFILQVVILSRQTALEWPTIEILVVDLELLSGRVSAEYRQPFIICVSIE